MRQTRRSSPGRLQDAAWLEVSHHVWVSRNSHGARLYSQGIYIDPKAGMVIVRFASHPLAGNVNLDPTSLPAYEAALANRLMGGSR